MLGDNQENNSSIQGNINKNKRTKKKKKKSKSNEDIIEEILKHIRSPSSKIPLIKLSVVFIYIGCLWLRLPVMISDFHTWITNEDIPYFSSLYCIPFKIKRLLRKKEINYLIPQQIPECEWLNVRTASMIRFYEDNFKFTFPPINYPVITCRILSIMALPAEAYLCVTRLIQLFKLDFTYHSYRSSPVVDLVAIIIIVVKFIYGLDNEIRFSDEFCKNFFPLNRWLDCLLQRRKEYDSHGLPIYENDYLLFINNNVDKFIEYCQKTFVDRHSTKDSIMKHYKLFKDIIKFIKIENLKEKRLHHNNSTENENGNIEQSLISSKNITTTNDNNDESERINETISGFKAVPINNKRKKTSHIKTDENSKEILKSNTVAASLSAIISPQIKKKDTIELDKTKNSIDDNSINNDSNTYNINNDKTNKRKYPGEHYITYNIDGVNGEYHTPYSVVLQYCQDIILRINDTSLPSKISHFERNLLQHEEWLNEYFKQDRFQLDIMKEEQEEKNIQTNKKSKKVNDKKKKKVETDSSDFSTDEENEFNLNDEFLAAYYNDKNLNNNENDNSNNNSNNNENHSNEYSDEEKNEETSYNDILIEALMTYEEKDEIEYPYN
ncbi:hypothetical protein H8356DRAFT_1627749 [Neocallimastix lanati (nom. inval.)]|nr:hypothetical protein H8356DRAFT_1627749 [Neocallimastix sp. JGI-2020a]